MQSHGRFFLLSRIFRLGRADFYRPLFAISTISNQYLRIAEHGSILKLCDFFRNSLSSKVRYASSKLVVISFEFFSALVGSSALIGSSAYQESVPNKEVTSGTSPWNRCILRDNDDPDGSLRLIGDVNQDGVVDLLDVAPFVELLNSGEFQIEGDINGDGEITLLDVGPFVDLINGN